MTSLNAKQLLNNLYGLLMEINFHKADDEIYEASKSDPQLSKHLLKIKQISTKLKAEANKQRFQKALEHINTLKKKGLEEVKKLIKPQDQAEFAPLFRKFEELTPGDEASILEDQSLLQLIETLKERLDDSNNE